MCKVYSMLLGMRVLLVGDLHKFTSKYILCFFVWVTHQHRAYPERYTTTNMLPFIKVFAGYDYTSWVVVKSLYKVSSVE